MTVHLALTQYYVSMRYIVHSTLLCSSSIVLNNDIITQQQIGKIIIELVTIIYLLTEIELHCYMLSRTQDTLGSLGIAVLIGNYWSLINTLADNRKRMGHSELYSRTLGHGQHLRAGCQVTTRPKSAVAKLSQVQVIQLSYNN